VLFVHLVLDPLIFKFRTWILLAFAFSSTPFEVTRAVLLPLVIVFRVGGLVVLGLLLPILGIRSSWARNAVDRMQVGRMCIILYAAFVLFIGGASVTIDV